MKNKFYKSIILVVASFLIALQPFYTAQAQTKNMITPTDQYFKNMNLQLHYETCDQNPQSNQQQDDKPGEQTPSSPGVGSGSCGEQGYANGARNSQANKQQIWDYLKGKGLSDEAAAGIMGNMDKESAFMPDAENSIGCRGVVQWCFGREDGLVQFAQNQGSDWTCLQTQLDYMWYEMTETSESQVMGPLKGAGTAGEAANIFHDIYERSNTATGEHLGRAERAEKVYSEFTGKSPNPVPQDTAEQASDTEEKADETPETCRTGKSEQDNGSGGEGSNAPPPPSEDCGELVKQINDMRGSGKIIQADDRWSNDSKNCTTGPIECGTGGGQGGVDPKILRATIAAANVSDEPLALWSFNSGHGCDGLNHPHGKAVDIPCGDSGQGEYTSMEKCRQIADYMIEHKEELGITELLWQSGYRCGDGVDCSEAGHGDHIHIGVE